jgi:hypothetical protein
VPYSVVVFVTDATFIDCVLCSKGVAGQLMESVNNIGVCIWLNRLRTFK